MYFPLGLIHEGLTRDQSQGRAVVGNVNGATASRD